MPRFSMPMALFRTYADRRQAVWWCTMLGYNEVFLVSHQIVLTPETMVLSAPAEVPDTKRALAPASKVNAAFFASVEDAGVIHHDVNARSAQWQAFSGSTLGEEP